MKNNYESRGVEIPRDMQRHKELMTKDERELHAIAKELGIELAADLSKLDIVKALSEHWGD